MEQSRQLIQINCASSGEVPGADAVCAELELILHSVDFQAPDRVRSFLRYIVSETLSGREARLKAYAIAIAVFGRNEDFDAMNDPVVRIEAGRLRRALERYYLLEGKGDEVVIEVAKGSYVPTFRWRHGGKQLAPEQELDRPNGESWVESFNFQKIASAPSVAACVLLLGLTLFLAVAMRTIRDDSAPQLPTTEVTAAPEIIVRPFVSLSSSPESVTFAAALSEEVLNRLAQQKQLRVFGRDGPADPLTRPRSYQVAHQYVVEGSVRQAGDKWRIITRLIDKRTAAVKWANSTDGELRDGSGEAILAADLADLVALQTRMRASPAEALARTATVPPKLGAASDSEAR